MKKESHHIDLLNGHIFPSLTGLALPIMATSLVQTAYNLTDMAWIGRVGSHAVTAVGAAGMYTWFSSGIVMLAKMGGQVKVAHSLGKTAERGSEGLRERSPAADSASCSCLCPDCQSVRGSSDWIFPPGKRWNSTGGNGLSSDYLRPDSVPVFEPDSDRIIYGSRGQQNPFFGKLYRTGYEHDPGSHSDFRNRTLSKNGSSRRCFGYSFGTDGGYPCFDDQSFPGTGSAS